MTERKTKAKAIDSFDDIHREYREIFKLDMLDMLLPDGTRFGDAFIVDLMPYADKTMDEIAALLVEAPDEDEADLLDDGDIPTSDTDFISEEEDKNPSGVVR